MALPDLASSSDLATRGVDVDALETDLVDTMLAVASATIRAAAGSPILAATSTVTLWGEGGKWLDLPGQPVTAVSSVVLDGTTLSATDYKLVNGRLWGACGWGSDCEPLSVVVALTHGLAAVPADIVDLCCSLTSAGLSAAAGGYESHAGKVAEMIGDYQVTWARGSDAVMSAMELPRTTRTWLRKRFGGGTGMVTYQ